MNEGISRVKKELLPQLKNVDEIVISHQITDEEIQAEQEKLGDNIKYISMKDKGLSKNRNHALKYATVDICHICDDDLDFIPGFEDIIKDEYRKKIADIITFQAINHKGEKHFYIKEGKHNRLSILRVWSRGVTFNRKKILENNIQFDENFGLGALYPVGEENIFLTDSFKQGLTMIHSNSPITIHPEESSGIDYQGREDLVVARIKLWKRIGGFLGGLVAIPYFTIFHYKRYKKHFPVWRFLKKSAKGLCEI